MTTTRRRRHGHIRLLSHPGHHGQKPLPIRWGAATPEARGPLIATLTNPAHRNVIGAHSGSYSVYRALAIASDNELGVWDLTASELRPISPGAGPVRSLRMHPDGSTLVTAQGKVQVWDMRTGGVRQSLDTSGANAPSSWRACPASATGSRSSPAVVPAS